MCKTGSLDRLDGQRIAPVAPQAVVRAVAPGQNPPQGEQGSVLCLSAERWAASMTPLCGVLEEENAAEWDEYAGRRATSSPGSGGKVSRRGERSVLAVLLSGGRG